MQVLSINRSLVKTVNINGKDAPTGIYKEPVFDPVAVHTLGLEGDAQADLTVHGGPHQAVYSYAIEHYPHWQQFLHRDHLHHGTFGENLTTSGLLETEVFVGDIHRMGSVVLQVTSCRLPCSKFAHKIGSTEILKPFLESGHSGLYYQVLQPGTITVGDPIEIIQRDPNAMTVRTVLGLYKFHEGTRDDLEKSLQIEALSPLFRKAIEARLQKP
ncbi:MOSC domain-containing protein [Phragmitibacter flavus]|uniref:MOSC domain-containing protein n=1 Tax=Phragmitibacter flavus TaxID=2576071 RepID=A0A5R8KJB4_9BACT|nr:MOSC domain-containing protein [Phragmitibacter flavus]TLD72341.1 MOSC domain-containing protein [Phragmitibacter flavus]